MFRDFWLDETLSGQGFRLSNRFNFLRYMSLVVSGLTRKRDTSAPASQIQIANSELQNPNLKALQNCRAEKGPAMPIPFPVHRLLAHLLVLVLVRVNHRQPLPPKPPPLAFAATGALFARFDTISQLGIIHVFAHLGAIKTYGMADLQQFFGVGGITRLQVG